MMAYHFNVVSHLIFGIAGVLLGYYLAMSPGEIIVCGNGSLLHNS